MHKTEQTEFEAAVKSLKEDPQEAILRVRGYVANYIGVPPEMLDDEPMDIKIRRAMERMRERKEA